MIHVATLILILMSVLTSALTSTLMQKSSLVEAQRRLMIEADRSLRRVLRHVMVRRMYVAQVHVEKQMKKRYIEI